MKLHHVFIALAVATIALLIGYAAYQDSQLTDERGRNTELQNKIDSLERQVTSLKETPENYFQRGVDMQYAGNFPEAKRDFEAVISKFPSSALAQSAQERLIIVNGEMARGAGKGAGEAGKTDKKPK